VSKFKPFLDTVLNICVSQGSVATYIRHDVNYDTHFVANLIRFPAVKEFLKLVKISQSYRQSSAAPVFRHNVISFAVFSENFVCNNLQSTCCKIMTYYVYITRM